jgi:hypothetical protein
VLAAELLQYVINEALQPGNFTMPIPHGSDNFPVVQYADDTVLLISADRQQILFLKNLLEQFAASTGLKVNYHKSYMIPLNVSDDKMQDFASAFGCQISSMTFTYLELPMGTTKPHFADLTPLIDRVERKLVAFSSYLSYTGRLITPRPLQGHLEKKGGNLAAWHIVQKPKHKGGLGVINLRL